MNILPVVFCFDDNWELAAGVCITSLLENAKTDTFYDIFILYSDQSKFQLNGNIDRIKESYSNCKITYRSVGDAFKEAFQIRGITQSTYYRLLIPELIPEYDKIMYHDVDVIFRTDLTDVFHNTDVEGNYIAGVVSSGGLNPNVNEKRAKLGFDWQNYILAGNIIMNSKLLREDSIVDLFKKEVATSQYECQDMDIINLICKGRIVRMAPSFCATVGIFELAANKTDQALYSQEELKDAENYGIIHYNGPKPWNEYCLNFDFWWEYYRRSLFFDSKFYYDFYQNKLDALDKLSLMKRVKILIRYFVKGRYK